MLQDHAKTPHLAPLDLLPGAGIEGRCIMLDGKAPFRNFVGCEASAQVRNAAFDQRLEIGNRLGVATYLTSIHLHGGSSGGPVFNERGHVFGIASCSYEGAEDVAFVTPIDPFFEIEISNVNLKDGYGPRGVTVGELARLGQIAMWNASNLK